MGPQITPLARDEVVVQRPTIFCRMLHVLPSTTAPGCRMTVTLADRQGMTVTVDLVVEELQTYERFQAALLRETGHPFRHLPVASLAAPTQTSLASESDVVSAAREKSAFALRAL